MNESVIMINEMPVAFVLGIKKRSGRKLMARLSSVVYDCDTAHFARV